MHNLRNVFGIAAVISSLALTANSASAFPGEGMRCEVKRTSDGFVALRRGPNASTQLIRKLRRPTGNSAFVDNVFPRERINGWVLVNAYRYDARYAEDDDRSVAWEGEGYIRANLINWSSCNNAG